jgi:hypothetical protein
VAEEAEEAVAEEAEEAVAEDHPQLPELPHRPMDHPTEASKAILPLSSTETDPKVTNS